MNQIDIGIGVMVFKEGRLLIGKRISSHGEGEYAWPGGKLHYLESFEACAKREVLEETGIEITNIRFLRLANLVQYAPKHFVDIALLADWKSGEPKVLEPNKHESWDWYSLDNLPSPLFDPCKLSIESLQNGGIYFDHHCD